jgi:hypothetical protein
MTPTKVWNQGTVVWQEADLEACVPEVAILVHVDNGGVIVLEQEGRHIVVGKGTVKGLCKVLTAIS